MRGSKRILSHNILYYILIKHILAIRVFYNDKNTYISKAFFLVLFFFYTELGFLVDLAVI